MINGPRETRWPRVLYSFKYGHLNFIARKKMRNPKNKTTKKKRKKRELKRPLDMFQSRKVYTQISGALRDTKMINGPRETRGPRVLFSFKDRKVEDFNSAREETALDKQMRRKQVLKWS